MGSLEIRGISFDHMKSGFVRKDLLQNHFYITESTQRSPPGILWDLLDIFSRMSSELPWYFFEILRVSLQLKELSSVNRHYYILSSVTSNNVAHVTHSFTRVSSSFFFASSPHFFTIFCFDSAVFSQFQYVDEDNHTWTRFTNQNILFNEVKHNNSSQNNSHKMIWGMPFLFPSLIH